MRVLVLNQAFYPDEVATSQYASDLAAELVEEGHDVTVLCSARGYDDPARKFPKRQIWKSVHIVRVNGSRFGKSSKWRRVADFATFLAACSFQLPRLGRFDVIIALTTPPLVSVLGALWKCLTGGRLVSWIMDLNPDEAIEAGWIDASSTAASILRAAQNFSLRQSDEIVVLDSFMRQRLIDGGAPADKIAVIPLWSQKNIARFDAAGRERFRSLHGWEDKFVVMYSGNHSPCHPLDTLVEAAHLLRFRDDIAFAFVGGGSEYRKLQTLAAAEDWTNVKCMPYQPREELAASLSAADLHTVVMGEPFVGIISPSKIYNILAVGSPVLYIGPAKSHVTELFERMDRAPHFHPAEHSDVSSVVQHILRARQRGFTPPKVRYDAAVCRDVLLPRMTELITGGQHRLTHGVSDLSSDSTATESCNVS